MLIQVTEGSAACLPMGLLSQPLGSSALRPCCPKCLSAEPSQGDPTLPNNLSLSSLVA